jgi:hypothetical protein
MVSCRSIYNGCYRYDPKMKTFYERILKKKGNQKARVAVARKMLVSILLCINKA